MRDAAVPLPRVGRRHPQGADRPTAQHGRRVDRLAGGHPGEAPAGAGAQVPGALGEDHQVGGQGQPGGQQPGVDGDRLQVAAEGLPDGDRSGQQPGLAQLGVAAGEGQREGALVGHHVDHPGARPVRGDRQGDRGEGRVQVGHHHRQPVQRVGVPEQLVVRRALLVGAGHHRLQRQVPRLDQVPGRLRRLGADPAARVEDRDHQRVAAGAQAAVQRRDVEQHPVAHRRSRREVGVRQRPHRRRGVGPGGGQLDGTGPVGAHRGHLAVGRHRVIMSSR